MRILDTIRRLSPIGALALLVPACGGTPAATPEMDQPPTASITATALKATTGTLTIPPGDSFECFYTGLTTDKEYSVVNAFGKQGPGGHHITVYYNQGRPQEVGHHPCTDEEMINWRMVAGANDENVENPSGEPAIELPPGLATKVAAGHQIVMQIHYINATEKTYKVNDEVTVNFVEPSKVKAYANYTVINGASFEIPAQQRMTYTTTCTMKQDYNVVLLLGHMHDYGKHFKLEQIDANNKLVDLIYEKDWVPAYASHPPLLLNTMEKPRVIPKGTRFRQTCEWDNTTNASIRFPREMCITFIYYFPDAGDQECVIDG